MKILIVGENKYPIYEEAFMKAFIEQGHKCTIFSWSQYFLKNSLLNKIENKFLYGFSIKKINKDLLKQVKILNPNFIFMYRPVMILPSVLKEIKRNNNHIKIFSYHNDDPFSKNIPKYKNRHFFASLSYCDWIFSYRNKNIDEYQQLGYKNTSLLRSYYLKNNNFHILNIEKKYDVLFIGHFEDDGRDKYILYLLKNNIKIKLFGTNWKASKYYEEIAKMIGRIQPIYGSEYNTAINSTKIALVFLSKLNNDTYTRRCFEIPITKTAMAVEKTHDLIDNLYTNKEAIYFTSKENLLEQLRHYLVNINEIKKIGEKGCQRLKLDGHEVTDRIITILKIYKRLKK